MSDGMNRRKFLNTSTLATAGLTILPSGMLRAAASPNSKLNIALIGMPVVLAYTACVYWIFRGKVRLGDNSY